MISVIMVSRNDDYGIALKQRTFHSLNAWAGVLSRRDEIIFIDDNTPVGKPTLAQEVFPALNAKTLSLLKVLRVSEETHNSFGVSIPVAENHCRNIGIRQARGEWIISTTNDNIPFDVYPRVLDLPYGFFLGNPQRVGPEYWLGFAGTDRLCRSLRYDYGLFPVGQLAADRRWLVHTKGGDLLLAPKAQLEEVRGFEEGMKDFGHGESNVARKMIARAYPILSHGIPLFHLEHSIQGSPAHFLDLKLNDWDHWCVNFWRTENPETWGEYPVEEIHLG